MDKSFGNKPVVFLLLIFGLVCFFIGLPGCGKKGPPAPVKTEDTFGWKKVQGEIKNDCLYVQAKMTGSYQSLKEIVLELEASQKICPECPFSPDQTILYPLSSKQVRKIGDHISLVCCQLEQKPVYRWRLRGKNIYAPIKDSLSKVQETKYEP